MMQIDFAHPSSAVAPYVSTFYYYRCDDAVVEGVERADVGQIRFMLKGHGALRFPGGHVEPSCPVMVSGPGTGAASWRVEGPFHCFGMALRPVGWGALIGIPADERADHVTDGVAVFGQEAAALYDALATCDGGVEAMVALAEPFIVRYARPLPIAHQQLCEAVRIWLANPLPQPVAALYASLAISPRQTERLVNRYFGAPPKLLERKFRALHAAAALLDGADAADIAGAFYDQSHMIREIRHFTGHTPGALATRIDPLLALTLQPQAFNELAPPG
ncbi:helix-turn-helix domain-containing protein [Sphingomonas baiyangensis]|uniref:Helix-turn-helix domain-containing protein n=1 Tax=Sphingomonas baiyangensis TaxID=2572576 RepID=A0A4U1L515_9SPHN|nr:helix-turn-helix domain-containing protein [Sphingomonas baiyangensis]TKD52021.1 helix-turn-helix domain-containing protein [Sphingomonas baiyangensis]